MGEVLKFVTTEGGLREKTQKNVHVFCKNNSILRPFRVKIRFERPFFLAAQNVHRISIKRTGGHKLNY